MQSKNYDNPTKRHISNRDESSFSLREVLNVIFRHKREIIIFFLVTVVTVSVFTFRATKIYESKSKILIKLGRENTSMDPTMMGSTVKVVQEFTNIMNNELKIIKSMYVVENLIDKIGREEFVGQKSKEFDAVESVMKNITVKIEKGSNVVTLSFQSHNPKLSQDALNSLMDIYMDRHIEIHRTQASPSFFYEQSEKFLEELKQKEAKLEQFRTERGIALLEEQKRALLNQISSHENAVSHASGQISSSQAKVASLTESLNKLSPTTETSRVRGNDIALGNIKSELNRLQMKEADLKNRYPDNSRVLKDLREQIKFTLLRYVAERDSDKNVEVTTGIDANYKTLQLDLEKERANLQSLIAMKQTIEKELERKKEELTTLSGHEVGLVRLRDDVKVTREEYRKYREGLHRANISAALDMGRISNISIIQEATLPIKHIKPKRRVNIALSIVLGFFGGIGLAYLLEYLDDSLKTVEDVRKRLDLPVLITVSLK